MHEPVELEGTREEDAAQHEPEAALRMRLGVGERQRRAPRAAEEQPLPDPEVPAQLLEIGDQVLRRVVGQLRRGRRAPRAALVEQRNAPDCRIEIAAMVRQAAPTRSAVQEHERYAGVIAAGLPVQRVPCVDGEPALRVGVDLREEDVDALLRVVRHVMAAHRWRPLRRAKVCSKTSGRATNPALAPRGKAL